MDLRQLECFLAVAKHLHFGKAAEELFLAQPTVSESVRRLETELGGALFDRTTRRVGLTPLGEMFVDEARMALEGVSAAYGRGRSYAQQQVTELSVGFAYDLGDPLVAVVAELQRCSPGVVVTLRARSTARQIRLLRERRLQAAFCVMPEPDPMFDTLVIGDLELVAVVRDDHPLARGSVVSLVELAREPLIAWPRAANPPLYDRFARAMDDTGAPWTLVGTAAGAENTAARVLAGFGVGLVFDSVGAGRPIPGVSYVALGPGAPRFERRLVWRRDERSRALAQFVDLARAQLVEPPRA
jgi:DNA-binding transcriptional LysR family regulator